MSTTIDYDLKRAMKFLSKDNRWNMLTVLMLHANERNRCWVSMDTIQEMATGGNRRKATRAKKWLEKHLAFELVPFDKRVGKELNLQPRQHIYQLTGLLQSCNDVKCDCGATGESFHYFYLGKSSPIDTIESDTIETFNSVPIDTRSISNEVYPVEVATSKPQSAPLDKKQQAEQLVTAWLKAAGKYAPLGYKHARMVDLAIGLLDQTPPVTADEVKECTTAQCKNRSTDYLFSYLIEDLVGFRARKAAQRPQPAKGLDAFSQHRLEMMQQEKAERKQAAS